MLRNILVPLSFVVASAIACEDAQGDFGKAEIKNPGVRVKETKTSPSEVPDFARAFTLTPRFDGNTQKLTVSLRFAEGYHAYAPGEEVGKPISMRIEEVNGWNLQDVRIPEGREKDLGDLGKSFVLEGAVDIEAQLAGGNGDIEGTVTVQVCTDKACDRPRPHRFRVSS